MKRIACTDLNTGRWTLTLSLKAYQITITRVYQDRETETICRVIFNQENSFERWINSEREIITVRVDKQSNGINATPSSPPPFHPFRFNFKSPPLSFTNSLISTLPNFGDSRSDSFLFKAFFVQLILLSIELSNKCLTSNFRLW